MWCECSVYPRDEKEKNKTKSANEVLSHSLLQQLEMLKFSSRKKIKAGTKAKENINNL